MINDKAMKLLTLALHPNTPLHEAESAGVFFVRFCRNQKLTAGDIINPPPVAPSAPIPKRTILVMLFGKYKGVNLDDLIAKDQAYCAWVVENIPTLKRIYKEYLLSKLMGTE